MFRRINIGLLALLSSCGLFAAPTEKATLAGGCFWCMEAPFEQLPGVVSAVSGYAGGQKKNPTYEEVSSGGTGHAEVVQITFDPARISYEQILEIFFKNIDPTDAGGQFVDRGSQYRPGIFFHSDTQRATAEKVRARMAASGRFKKPIVTEITLLDVF